MQWSWGLACIPLIPLLATPVPNLPLYYAGYKVGSLLPPKTTVALTVFACRQSGTTVGPDGYEHRCSTAFEIKCSRAGIAESTGHMRIQMLTSVMCAGVLSTYSIDGV